MEVAEAGAGAQGGDAGALGGEDEVVGLALDGGEGAAEREGAGDVGGVEGVGFDAGVQQEQGVRVEGAVVADPVQDAGVGAGGGDGGVGGAVALGAGAQVEDAFDPAFAAVVAQCGGQGADDVLEAGDGVVDGELQLFDLPGVLDQAQLGEDGGEFAVLAGGGAPPGGLVHLCVGAGQDAGGRLWAGEQLGQVVEVFGAYSGEPGGFGEVGAGADPELAVAAVAVELAAVARGSGAQVEDGFVAFGACRFEDEDVVGLVLAGESGEPDVRAVRAEAVVQVVAADLEAAGRDDQPLAGEGGAEAGAAAGEAVVAGDAEVGGEGGGGPAGAHEGGEGGGDREVVAPGVEAGRGCGHR